MASVIKAGNATDGVQVTSDNTGILELKTGTGSGTTAMTVGTGQNVTFAQAANLPNTFGFKNRIINGDMRIDQRNAGASVTPNNAYTLDRWQLENAQTGKVSIQQNAGSVTPPAGFVNYLGVTSLSAYSVLTADYFLLTHIIEGLNTGDLAWGTANAQAVTISFWVRSSLTGTFGAAVNNNAQNRTYPFTYTISSANTWEQKTVTIPGDTSGTWLTTNGIGIRLRFNLGTGATYSGTAGAWTGTSNVFAPTGATSVVGTNGATFYITGVQLEKGSTATSFDYRPYSTELQLCQRYCQVISGAGVSNNYQRIGYGPGTSTSGGLTQVQLKATMRIAPTLTATAANTFTVFDGVTLTTLTNLVIDAANSQNLAYVVWSVAGTPLTATRAYELLFNNTASGSFALSAEL